MEIEDFLDALRETEPSAIREVFTGNKPYTLPFKSPDYQVSSIHLRYENYFKASSGSGFKATLFTLGPQRGYYCHSQYRHGKGHRTIHDSQYKEVHLCGIGRLRSMTMSGANSTSPPRATSR